MKKKIILAVSKARKQKFLNYKKSIKLNFTNTYSKIIKKFSKPQLDFEEGQKETKLNPY